jgi:hypothetical protein
VFECQLLPSILYELKVDDFAGSSTFPDASSNNTKSNVVTDTPPLKEVSAAAAADEEEGEEDREEEEDDDNLLSEEAARAELRGICEANGGVAGELGQGMDWGTLAVYSCSDSCEESKEEYVVVHGPVN